MTAYSQFFGEASSIPNFAEALTRMLNPYESVSLRVPFYITNDYRLKRGLKGISMLMNPTSVSFKQNKRITRKDTQGGATFFHWTNQKGSNNDILQMEFSGMSGNINLNRGAYTKGGFLSTATGYVNKASDWMNQKLSDASSAVESGLSLQAKGTVQNQAGVSKLASFWSLYSITREPVLDPEFKSPVYTYICYSSPLFGNTSITFVGHFDRVMDISDVADEPFNKRWSFGFTATGSNPTLDKIYSTMIYSLSQSYSNDLGQ